MLDPRRSDRSVVAGLNSDEGDAVLAGANSIRQAQGLALAATRALGNEAAVAEMI
jgi:hypothetical protein